MNEKIAYFSADNFGLIDEFTAIEDNEDEIDTNIEPVFGGFVDNKIVKNVRLTLRQQTVLHKKMVKFYSQKQEPGSGHRFALDNEINYRVIEKYLQQELIIYFVSTLEFRRI